jgi:hypothetical protein
MSQSSAVYDALVAERLSNQCLTRVRHRTPADLVAWFGAVQAQEYRPAKWGLSLRLPDGTTDARIERALSDGSILRTHVLRPTWHFVAAADLRWMLDLTAARIHRAMATYRRHAGLGEKELTRAIAVIERGLEKRALTRAELRAALARGGITANSMQMAYHSMYAELEGVVCSGPRRGPLHTYALFAERVPRARRLPRDEALAELTARYFRSHGPATIADFVWWSGLTVADAKRGLEINRAKSDTIDGRTYWTIGRARPPAPAQGTAYLLPIYDEYLVAYRDRAAVPHGPAKVGAGAETSVTFQHAMIVDGRVAGTWRTTAGPSGAKPALFPTRRLSASQRRSLAGAVERYERFVESA